VTAFQKNQIVYWPEYGACIGTETFVHSVPLGDARTAICASDALPWRGSVCLHLSKFH
jgi:hypothetical protein